jgi:FixJ family two-component response regulator
MDKQINPVIYIVDDDTSVRRAMRRLIRLPAWRSGLSHQLRSFWRLIPKSQRLHDRRYQIEGEKRSGTSG